MSEINSKSKIKTSEIMWTPHFDSGLFFCALLLCMLGTGLSLGLWFGRRGSTSLEPASLETYHLLNLLRGMSKWTNGFADDVSRYRQAVDAASQRYRSDPKGQHHQAEVDESVKGMLSQIAQANSDLQNRLDRAETTLQDQAKEIAGYMSEARTDSLTGLPNRRVFDDELGRRVAELRRNGTPVSVLLADIDHFKRFNDLYGHQAGDTVLEQVARTLRETLRKTDIVARIGGEEFAVVMPGSSSGYACEAAERARLAISNAVFRYESKQLRVSISCGTAQASRDENAPSLVKRTDEALYASKGAGRNAAHWHDGLQCILISPEVPLAWDAARAVDQPLPTDNGFRQVCHDLRERLLNVVDEESGLPA